VRELSTLAVLLKESWSFVEDRADDLADNFFARLFVADPYLREQFPVAMAEPRRKFLALLVNLIEVADDPAAFRGLFDPLGQRHWRFRIEPRHYLLMRDAWVDSLRQYCGDRFTDGHERAWHDAFGFVVGVVQPQVEPAADRPSFWHAEVVGHERRGRDVAVITCRPLEPYDFQPGQYATIETDHRPGEWRHYSIANAPRADGSLEFHIRARGGGWLSSALVRRLGVGDRLRLSSPMGSMTLDPASGREVVCVAGGTGLAPMKALVEELTRRNSTQWVHVFVGARDRDDLYDLPALQRLSVRYPWLSLVPACSSDPGYAGERGRINEVLERYGPWQEHDFFVCGPTAMVRATLETLEKLSVPAGRIRYDAPESSSS
jgi:NAD(P)H-flavin reductase/hemoglobin-like flavoprotein